MNSPTDIALLLRIARIPTSGSPISHSGDLYGQIEYVTGKSGPRALQIDRLSP